MSFPVGGNGNVQLSAKDSFYTGVAKKPTLRSSNRGRPKDLMEHGESGPAMAVETAKANVSVRLLIIGGCIREEE